MDKTRRVDRSATFIPAFFRVLGVPCAVEVRDLSSTGFKIESFDKFGEGTRGTLKIEGFEAWGAIVAWRSGDDTGCQFDRPLHPAVTDPIA